jgi:NAD(P)-dependent dehydrogenase (short-subunit alcohol dehydrogenase family)
LCKQFDGSVYLTGNCISYKDNILFKQFNLFFLARNIDLGKEAIEKLNREEGLNPNFRQLEINNDESVEEFSKYIARKYGGLDILVNNAAILLLVRFFYNCFNNYY